MEADADTIRSALAGLITEGLLPWNVLENGGHLLDLEMVRSRVDVNESASEAEHADAYAQALAEVLSEAVQSDEIGGKSRRLLACVLPLDPRYLGASVKERRIAAGTDLKPGKRPISPGTIRTYYEPKALDRLARVLVTREIAFRARA